MCTALDEQLFDHQVEMAELRAQLAAATEAAAETAAAHGQLLHVPVHISCGSK